METLIRHVLDNYLYDTTLSSNTYYETINEIIINGNIKGNRINGTNAHLSENVTAKCFNGNLLGSGNLNNLFMYFCFLLTRFLLTCECGQCVGMF